MGARVTPGRFARPPTGNENVAPPGPVGLFGRTSSAATHVDGYFVDPTYFYLDDVAIQ